MPHNDRNGQGSREVERALEVLNAEPTEEFLVGRIAELTGDKKLAKLGSAIFSRRSEIGSFRDLGDLESVEGVSTADIAALIDGLTLPPYDFETETLELVQWVHGTEVMIEDESVFGSIQRRRQGLLVPSGVRSLDPSDPPNLGFSWAHASVPVPSFHEGKQFYVKSVLFSFESYSQAFGIQGRPIATPFDIEVWDGHVRIAETRMPVLTGASNRYVRVPVESAWKVRRGLALAFQLVVMPFVEGDDLSFWIDLGAVGVELVTRTGQVVNPVAG